MKARLLFIISSLNTGGAQSSMANFSLALSEKYDIDWLLNSDENIVYEYSGNIISLGIHEPKNREAMGYQLKAFVRRLRMLKKLKRSGGYTAAVSFLESANVANILTRDRAVKTIISQRNSDVERNSFIRKAIKSAEKSLYKKADAIVAISEGVRRELTTAYSISSDKTVTIINGYDIEKIRRLAAEQDPEIKRDDETFTFVTSGRIDRLKGQWHLIRAFSKVHKDNPATRLLILGDGAEKEYLGSVISKLGLEEAVRVLSFRANPFAVLEKCDAFVFPSLSEGFGNALCEALICGLPSIASDYRYGAREILAPDTDPMPVLADSIEEARYGMLVPVCSGRQYEGPEPLERQEELLAGAMQRLMDEKEIYAGYKAAAAERAAQLSFANKCVEWDRVIMRRI